MISLNSDSESMQVSFLSFVYICIAVGDPVIKREGLEIQLSRGEGWDLQPGATDDLLSKSCEFDLNTGNTDKRSLPWHRSPFTVLLIHRCFHYTIGLYALISHSYERSCVIDILYSREKIEASKLFTYYENKLKWIMFYHYIYPWVFQL
jgi:hypothetical protein